VSGKITAIERAAEGLPLTVYVDGRPALEMSEEMAERLGLEVGMELGASGPRATTEGADEDREPVRAREAAFRLLAVRARGVRELRDRLARKGFAPDVVGETLRALESAGLLDDRAFAMAWADERVRLRPVGPVRLRQELLAKGIHGGLVDEVVTRTFSEHDELELATRVLRKRTRGRAPGPRETARLNAFLLRRGFSYETASLALRALGSDDDDRRDGGR